LSAAESINPAIAHVPLTTPKDFTREILREVARQHGVTVKELMGKSRVHRISHARQVAIRRLLEAKPAWTIADAARFFDMDHTTALYALDRTGGGRLGRAWGVTRSERNERFNAGANSNTNEEAAANG